MLIYEQFGFLYKFQYSVFLIDSAALFLNPAEDWGALRALMGGFRALLGGPNPNPNLNPNPNPVQRRTVLYCTVLYITVLYCTVLYCTILYCTMTVFRQILETHYQTFHFNMEAARF